MPPAPPLAPWRHLRKEAVTRTLGAGFSALSALGRLAPQAKPAQYGIERVRSVPYGPSGLSAHTLDVYRPAPREDKRPLPVALYLHGGGFRNLNKDTHWVMGLALARRGYLVFMPNYRRAPAHPFPAAAEDACRAYAWVVEHARAYGGDPARIVLCGESAGANLAAVVTAACCIERPEPWAGVALQAPAHPVATVAFCGIHQVSDTRRFHRAGDVGWIVGDRLIDVEMSYLQGDHAGADGTLADPVVVLEQADRPLEPLPPLFAPCGTADVLIDDSRRLVAAARRLGGTATMVEYPGEPHAFHALVWRPAAQQCWRDTYDFLDTHVDDGDG